MMLDERTVFDFKMAFPFANELGDLEELFFSRLYLQKLDNGTVLLDESRECTGVIFVLSGSIRIYKISDEGREITLYRISRGETCVLTVACLMGTGNIPFPVAASAEQKSEVVFMPVEQFRQFFYKSGSIQKFLFSSMSAKFYSILGLVENITFRRTSDRLMDYIISKSAGGTYPVYATHESIASDLGTAREVISRLLKDMESKGIVSLNRGKIIYNPPKNV